MPSNDEIRLQILEILNEYELDNPARIGPDRNMMLDLLKEKFGTEVNDRLMDSNMLYLEKKNLVRLYKGPSQPWYNANITSSGIDVIENKGRFRRQTYSQLQELPPQL